MSQSAAGAPKIMSSRLANMKFMQRAAVSTPLPPSPTPTASEKQPSSKKLKSSHGQETLPKRESNTNSSHKETLQPLGMTGAETMWTLEGMDQTVRDVDSDAYDKETAPWEDSGSFTKGRVRYGDYKKAVEKPVYADENEAEVSDDIVDSNSNSSPGDGEARQFAEQNLARVREVRAQRAKAERERSRKVVGERKRKLVPLNPKKSNQQARAGISSGGR